jgi:hypothetical protein
MPAALSLGRSQIQRLVSLVASQQIEDRDDLSLESALSIGADCRFPLGGEPGNFAL